MATTELRLSYSECRELLQRRLAEPAPGRVQLLTGPRQVGKTTLLLELAGELGDIAIYAAADAPEAALPGFLDRLWAGAESTVKAGLELDGFTGLDFDTPAGVGGWSGWSHGVGSFPGLEGSVR